MFTFLKKILIGLLTSIANASNHTKCVSLSNQKCTTQSILMNLNLNECTQGLHCYPFSVNLDRCIRSCYTLNSLSNKVCFQNETENLNLRFSNMVTEINESKTLTRHNISCKWKCKFDGRKCNSNHKRNNNKCWRKCKNRKDYIWNPATCSCEKSKYLASIINDSVIICEEIIKETKTIPTKILPAKAIQQI